MCHFLLGWGFVVWGVGVHAFVGMIEVAVNWSGDASAVVGLFGVVEEGSWYYGAWRWLGGFG